MTEALSEYLTLVKEIHFTQIRRRVLAMIRKKKKPEYVDRIGESINDDPLTIIVDSTGLSTTTRVRTSRRCGAERRGSSSKLHIVADKKTGKIVGFRVTSQKTGDTKKFVPMVKEVAKKRKVAKAYADAAYDSRSNFNLLREIGAEPAIKLRRNASQRSMGSPSRRQEAILLDGLGYDGWKTVKDYGKRWMVEMVFAAFKKVLGDTLMSKSFLAQKTEATLKVILYNKFMSI